jgi:DNA-binding response OmpR family regulator
MSGLDLGKRLRAVQDPTPIIFITAQDSSEIRAQVADSGGAVFFRKTDSGVDILAAIRHAISLEEAGP